MKHKHLAITGALLACSFATSINAAQLKVNITKQLANVNVIHNGESVTIQRNQHIKNTVNPAFAKTSRNCPPFCINPIELSPGVETLGELEIIDYIKQMSDGDKSILVIDSRTPSWVRKGTIPGAINIPWVDLSVEKGADIASISKIITKQFHARKLGDGSYNFSDAKTLVMFCNGMWCGQSPNNIRSLLKMGYPADKIKWYRGGMQNWENLGFNTVR